MVPQYGAPGQIVASGNPAALAPMQLPKTIVRIGEQAIWSTQQYADAQAMARNEDILFSTPQNGTGQGFAAPLSLAETNLREASRIPGGYAFTVQAIALQTYYSDQFAIVRADIANLVNNCVPQWSFLQVRIEIAPAQLIGAGGGVYGDTADTGAAEGGAGGSRIALNNGNGQVWVYRSHPVALPANSTYNIVLSWGANASAVDGGSNNSSQNVRCVLLGTFESAIPIA
jgi:hypothetical protein